MSMYLPNSDLQPTGFEPAEFIEPPLPLPRPPEPAAARNPDEVAGPADDAPAL
jgi:hypothetical protein